jgi:hypothetical protein
MSKLILAAMLLLVIGKSAAQDWKYGEPTDELTGKKTFNATRTFHFSGGNAIMTAACDENSILGGTFYITLLFGNGRHPQGALNVDESSFVSQGGAIGGRLRFSEAAGDETSVGAEMLHTNEMKLSLFNLAVSQAFGPNNTLKSFLDAKYAKVEVPFSTGPVIIDLQPTDPDLRKVLGYCLYPKHRPQGLN